MKREKYGHVPGENPVSMNIPTMYLALDMQTGLSQLLLSLGVGLGLAGVLTLNLWALKKFRSSTFTRVVHFIIKSK
jgi:hypothetical protein